MNTPYRMPKWWWGLLLVVQGTSWQYAAQTPVPASPTPCPARDEAVRSMIARAKVIPAFTNSLGMVFVRIARTDVLFCMWDTCLWEYSLYAASIDVVDTSWQTPGFAQEPTHPVVNVGWDDTKRFCLWLTEHDNKKGLLRENQYYRLPTDAEWSKAAGLKEPEIGEPTSRVRLLPAIYPWGKQWPPPTNSGNYCSIYHCDPYPYTSRVGKFGANQFGLYDMGGNVGQWVEDRYGEDNPDCRAWRNTGTWYSDGTHMLSLTGRGCNWPDNPYNALGFRVVLAGKPIQMKATQWRNRSKAK